MNRRDWILSAAVAGASCLARPLVADEIEPNWLTSSHGFTNLSINESQFGPSPHARKAMQEAMQYANEYPLDSQLRLREAISRSEKVTTDQVILGAGSSDIMMAAATAFGMGGGNIVSSDPSFAPLMTWAEKFGVAHVKIPWRADYAVDLDRIEESITSDTKIVYICNPENPVGTLLDPDELHAFCRRVAERCPVFVDEAYLDFAGDAAELSMMRCVREGLPVIVLRTFSKAYGLGGMRVGYAVTSKEIAKRLSGHYVTGIGCGCSHLSLEAAIAAYGDQEWLAQVRDQTETSRSFFCNFIADSGYRYIPSVTTFVLVPVPQDSQKLADAIFGGFKIRVSPRNYYGQNYLRVSMGRMDQMKTLADALAYVL